jgi:hypothetical protein
VAAQLAHRGTRLDVPKPHDMIVAASYQNSPVGTQSHGRKNRRRSTRSPRGKRDHTIGRKLGRF